MGKLIETAYFFAGTKTRRVISAGVLLGILIASSSEESNFFNPPEHHESRQYSCDSTEMIGQIALGNNEVQAFIEGELPKDVAALDDNGNYDPAYIRVVADKSLEDTKKLDDFYEAEYEMERLRGWNTSTNLRIADLEGNTAALIQSRCDAFPQK